MHLGFRAGLVFPDDLPLAVELDRAAAMAEEKIAVAQDPAVLRMLAGILPFDFPVRVDQCDFVAGGIRAEKRVRRPCS